MIIDKQTKAPVPPGDIVPDPPEDLELLALDLLSVKPQDRSSISEILNIVDRGRPDSILAGGIDLPVRSADKFFVGRQTELALLWDTFARTCSRKSFESVVIEGVSGVGKSALIERWSAELLSAEPTTVVLRGRCYERESAPFKAFDGVVESLVRHIRCLPREAADHRSGR